jgi:hypothetical protein
VLQPPVCQPATSFPQTGGGETLLTRNGEMYSAKIEERKVSRLKWIEIFATSNPVET